MKIAIIGGGISGLTAAYELEKKRLAGADIDWALYEASDRFGGIIATTRTADNFLLEAGPDGWITEKPWARDLAIELGVAAELVPSNDATRKTYILLNDQLVPIPALMRLMVPEDLATLEDSPLFSSTAKQAYAEELTRADELRIAAPQHDESVASFVRRHFGDEVLNTLAAPLLSGVFGGDVERLSVRAVMPQFVAMEREHGSLIAALQTKAAERGNRPAQPIFTSLRNGLGSLIHALLRHLPADRLHLDRPALSLKREGNRWCLRTAKPSLGGRVGKSKKHFQHILLATPADATRMLLQPLSPAAAELLPAESSSAVLAAFAWSADSAATFNLPQGFGFLVPQQPTDAAQLLACTFVDQKFPHRAPPGGRIVRAFFGGASYEAFQHATDAEVAAHALASLSNILGPLPAPLHTSIHRWPHSLPQYDVGHLDRMSRLDALIASLPGLTLLGNPYRGVGLPDLIRDARAYVPRPLD